ncbi:MAG TPA: hypothetical protein VN580_01545 [Clostridia bacterium]|nr:hypothetical protein [Clostridia bacterium]
MNINKLMGFYELKAVNIPTVPWKKYSRGTVLDSGILWTVRVALKSGADVSLPRAVGVTAGEAVEKADAFLGMYGDNGLVIYYPYFIADKSGVIDISSGRTVIEAVDKDLWNLVTHGRKNVTITIGDSGASYDGDRSFLPEAELSLLQDSISRIKAYYRGLLSEGKSIITEWSFAYSSGIDGRPSGEKFLVFYELRSV